MHVLVVGPGLLFALLLQTTACVWGGMCAVAAPVLASSLGGISKEETASVEWMLSQVRKTGCKKLSLTMELWDHVSRKWKTIPDAHHIHRVLSMKKEHRILLWRMLCPGVCWEKVQMGGQSLGPKCRVEDDDFATLCATGSMEGVKHLLLHCMDRVTDQCFLSLAQAGCGTQLTSLFLSGLGEGVTDEGCRALGRAGCGVQLISLSLVDLQEGVTDVGLCALADAGCGARLTSLTLYKLMKGVTDRSLQALSRAGCGPQLTDLHLGYLMELVTDEGLCALATRGCGAQLKSLILDCT